MLFLYHNMTKKRRIIVQKKPFAKPTGNAEGFCFKTQIFFIFLDKRISAGGNLSHDP